MSSLEPQRSLKALRKNLKTARAKKHRLPDNKNNKEKKGKPEAAMSTSTAVTREPADAGAKSPQKQGDSSDKPGLGNEEAGDASSGVNGGDEGEGSDGADGEVEDELAGKGEDEGTDDDEDSEESNEKDIKDSDDDGDSSDDDSDDKEEDDSQEDSGKDESSDESQDGEKGDGEQTGGEQSAVDDKKDEATARSTPPGAASSSTLEGSEPVPNNENNTIINPAPVTAVQNVQVEKDVKPSFPRLSPPATQLNEPSRISLSPVLPPLSPEPDLPDLQTLISGTQVPRIETPMAPPVSQGKKPKPSPRPIVKSPQKQQQSTFKDLSQTPRPSQQKNKRKLEFELVGTPNQPVPGDKDSSQGKGKAKAKEESPEPMPAPKRARFTPPTSTPNLSQTSSQNQGKRKQRARRHETFWHLDGSVIIQIQDILFKLHRSRLVKQSKYFSELLSSAPRADAKDDDVEMGDEDDARVTGEAAGPSGRRTMDGCVVYEIAVTTASDFDCLLVALDEGMSYVIDPPPFHTLAAILRAASALQFKTLQTWATRTLEQMWSSDISDLTEKPVPNAAATVILAKQCGVPKVLKRAYYELLRTSAFGQGSLDDEADAVDEDDEDEIQIISVNGRLESAMHKNATNQNKAGRTRLPHAEIVRLIETRQRLLADWVAAAAAPEPFNCSGAPSSKTDEPPAASSSAPSGSQKPPSVAGNGKPVACVAADRAANDAKWSRLVLRGQIFENYLYDPIIGLDQLCEIKWRQEGYCKKCHDARIDAWRRRQEKLWDNLDAWLGLPTGRR